MIAKHLLRFLFIIIFTCHFTVYSQISGIINVYSEITGKSTGNSVDVGNGALFSIGNRVLIIQMKGAKIITDTSVNYGNIINSGNAGNYEFNDIANINGNNIQFKKPLTNTYNGTEDTIFKAQLIKVPQYTNPVISGILKAKAWDGKTGGVLVLEASGTITMNADIDVSGTGFRGGIAPEIGSSMPGTKYASTNLPDYGYKGEGIAINIPKGYDRSKGKAANGGGGGIPDAAGGAGGSNYGEGGNGGMSNSYSYGGSLDKCAIGGVSLSDIGYSIYNNRVFMGGGGCSGTWNNKRTDNYGGNGGGIVIIRAQKLTGNSHKILANGTMGYNNKECTPTGIGRGGSGGGAGGSILLDIKDFGTLPLTASANGADGICGKHTSRKNNALGGGGGGGGGVIWLNSNTIPANLTYSINGGNLGTGRDSGCVDQGARGATNGSPGAILTQLILPPLSLLASGPTSFCTGDSVILKSSCPLTGAKFKWIKDSKIISGDTSNILIIKQTGKYMVIITTGTVIDSSFIMDVKVNPLPDATFIYVTETSGTGVTFNCSNTVNINNFWDFGDQIKTNESNPRHVFPKDGYYRVSLTQRDTITGCLNKTEQKISVGNVVNSCFAKISYKTGTGNTVNFTDSSSGNINLWYWEFGNGYISTQQNPVYTYPDNGIYKISLSVKNNNGCISTDHKTIIIGSNYKNCNADFTYFSDLSSKTVYFTDRSTGNKNSLLWNFDDGYSSSVINPIHIYTGQGYYNVCLNIMDSSGKCYSTKCQMIKAGDYLGSCNADFDKIIDYSKQTVSFLDKSAGEPISWYWDFGDNTGISSAMNPVYTYINKDTYLVQLITTNIYECSSKKAEIVNFKQNTNKIIGMFEYTKLPSVSDGMFYPIRFISATFGEPSKFVWDFGDKTSDSTTTTPLHYYSALGTYKVCLTVSSALDGQIDKYCKNVIVTPDGIDIKEQNNFMVSNYPNPVSSTTMISYSIETSTPVALNIYDIMGNKIYTLINEKQKQGNYTLEWNRKNLMDGIYFLQLKTNRGNVVRKIVLVR
ncbi:MAG: PKD domain-containing protein [Bacteroidota bacterium]|nr:PKD domain-containing protein [Bacteroidota bacterium]